MDDVLPDYKKLIHEEEDKGFQIWLTVTTFRGTQYFHIRRYYRDYEGEYVPSKEGVAFPVNIVSLTNLLASLIELSSFEESKELIKELYKPYE